MQEKSQDGPVNIINLTQAKAKKYEKVKAGEFFQPDDLIYLSDDEYVKVSDGSALLKYKINQQNIVLRKKK